MKLGATIVFVIVLVGILILNKANEKKDVDIYEFIPNWQQLLQYDQVFIKSVYRVKDDEYRIIIVMNSLVNSTIQYSFERETWNNLSIKCQRKGECPRKFSYACVYNGYIGYINEKNNVTRKNSTFIYLRNLKNFKFVKVKIRDVRLPTDRNSHHSSYSTVGFKHKLGICVQPLFLYSNWTMFILFFEYWLSQGVTVFYLYYSSISTSVYDIIRYYQSTAKNVEIHLIDWSIFPINDANNKNKNYSNSKHSNPNLNLYTYRLEPELAIFDCMHNARNHVEFTVQTDIDEIIQLSSGQKVIDFLEKLRKLHPDMASVNFKSQRIKTDFDWNQVSDPNAFNFHPLKYTVQFENKAFERSLYSKNIYIPHRVRNYDIHFRLDTEEVEDAFKSDSIDHDDKTYSSNVYLQKAGDSSGHNDNIVKEPRYIHHNISASEGRILHLRQINDIFPWKNSKFSLDLIELANELDYNFMRRKIRAPVYGNFESYSRVGYYLSIKLEECRQKLLMERRGKCPSLELCQDFEEIKRIKWKISRNSWIVL